MAEDSVFYSGMRVVVRRSDGRCQNAIVSSLNMTDRYACVEWMESNEVKGKEVDLDSLLNLNPELTADSVRKYRGSMNKTTTKRSTLSIPLPTSKIVRPRMFGSLRKSQSPSFPSDQPLGTRQSSRSLNTFQEVERLKKDREARRQRQAEQKVGKIAQLRTNSLNPNWQLDNMIRQYRETTDFQPIRGETPPQSHQITVCVRKRPLNRRERVRHEVDVISIPRRDLIVVHEPKNKVDLTKYLDNQQFRFDFAFDEKCDNSTVYNYTAKPMVRTIFEGGMATCFAYGQTGSGKTHTMSGSATGEPGIYSLVARDVFLYLNSSEYKDKRLTVTCSYFEIYSGKVLDLLADKRQLRVLEDGKHQVQVVGLSERVVQTVEEVLAFISKANRTRTSGKTSANSNSSRSHAVFRLALRSSGSDLYGQFYLIDLAGNERGADTNSDSRHVRMEGAEINKSLLALKECIRALGRKGAHLPFRGSTLTLILRDSFIGDNAKTCMIAMISPSMNSCEHTLNTLRYADRVKELVAEDTIGEDEEGAEEGVKECEEVEEMTEEDELATDADDEKSFAREDWAKTNIEEALRGWRQRCLEWDEREDGVIVDRNSFDAHVISQELIAILTERAECMEQFKAHIQGIVTSSKSSLGMC